MFVSVPVCSPRLHIFYRQTAQGDHSNEGSLRVKWSNLRMMIVEMVSDLRQKMLDPRFLQTS